MWGACKRRSWVGREVNVSGSPRPAPGGGCTEGRPSHDGLASVHAQRLLQAPEERGGPPQTESLIFPLDLPFPSSHLPPPGLLGGPRGQLLSSLKIARPALSVKEPLLLAEPRRPGRWQLVSVAPLSLRDQILLCKCRPWFPPKSQLPHALISMFPCITVTPLYRFTQ